MKRVTETIFWLLLPLLATAVFALHYHHTTAGQTAMAAPHSGGQPVVTLVETFPNLTFDQPVDIANAGDGRLFIVERQGIIRVVPLDPETVTATTFLSITNRVDDTFNSEAGLLGLTFHPDYDQNGFFYVNYTRTAGNEHYTRISRFSVSAGDPDQADAGSEHPLFEIEQPHGNHNAGDLNFGPDGYLYFGLGDGGSSGDPDDRAQTLTDLLGKMIRIDVTTDPDNYTIPEDNPFVGQAGEDEIWAYGLRNPWRFSFDRLTGDMYIGDVGQGSWEEIDLQLASSSGGENYGWRCYEGNNPFNLQGCDENTAVYDFPIHEYATHVAGTCAVTGGFVYRGSDFPSLQGYYIYADYCSGDIWGLYPDGQDGWTNTPLADLGDLVSTFGEDAAGELYLARYSANGKIFQIQAPSSAPALSITKEGPATAAAGQPITYSLTVSNSGTLTATNLRITDTLPSPANYAGSSNGGTLSAGTVRWDLPALSPSGTVTVQLVVTTGLTIVNEDYGVTADGGYQAQGSVAVETVITDEKTIYLPTIYRPD